MKNLKKKFRLMSDDKKVHDLRNNRDIKKKDDYVLFTTITGKGINIRANEYVIMQTGSKSAEYLVHTVKYYFRTRFKATLIFVRYIN